MKVTTDNQNTLKLVDNNYNHIWSGAVFFVFGTIMAIFGMKNPLNASIGILFVLASIYTVITRKVVRADLDRTLRRGRFSFRSLVKSQQRDVPFDQISEVALNGHYVNVQGGGRFLQYNLEFSLKDSDPITLEFGRIRAGLSTYIFASSGSEKREDAKKVAEFIGVKLRLNEPSDMGPVFSLDHGSMNQNKPRSIGDDKKKIDEI